MKRNFVKTIGGTVLAFMVISALAFGLVFAQNESKSESRSGSDRLIGTWDAQVTIRNCQTGAAIRTFASIGTFMSGGTMLDSTSGVPQALKTPGHGVWSHISGNTYRFKFKSFSFDASGNFTGWTIINHEANLDRRADEYESAGTAEVYAPNGNLLFTGCSTTTATRFE
ncbi:MAG: hypothetical protein M3367_06075 [Acidobacteriota bacterium]|nr:hypothetical protein [Acidobacteriota bacterium]